MDNEVPKTELHEAIGLRVRELIQQTCTSLDVYIEKGHVAKDHVHLLVSVPPNIAVSEFVQRLKERSSRLTLQEFEELKKPTGDNSYGHEVFCGKHRECDG